jgi:phage terminase small subunit
VTPKQKRFCDEYLIDTNATQAAIRAGYSEKTAYSIGQRLLKDVEVAAYIKERAEQINNKTIADATEVMRYLTSVLRGEETEEIIVVEGMGDGCSSARRIDKRVGAKEMIRAAELIGKRYGLFTDKVGIEGVVPIVIAGDDELAD